MKSIKILSMLLFFISTQSQVISFTVADKTTKTPIENVNISLLDSNEGTISNSEGNVKIFVNKKSEIKISNISYEEQVLQTDVLKSNDTIYLMPQIIQLDEVVINSFDLNKALQYVLDNYSKLYVDESFEKKCDFKETVLIKDVLKRLIVTKVNWWDISYGRKANNVKFRLGAISYNKNIPFDIFTDVPQLNKPSKSGYIELISLVETIYLSSILVGLIPDVKNSSIKIERSPKDVIVCAFETEWIKNKSSKNINASIKFTGKCTFDKTSKALVAIEYTVNHEGNIVKDTVEATKKPTITETKNSYFAMSFYNSLNGKLSLKTYETGNEVDFTYGDVVNNLKFINKISVLAEKSAKKVNNKGLIDISKPIYESLPSDEIKSSNSVLLNSAEKEFIFGKN